MLLSLPVVLYCLIIGEIGSRLTTAGGASEASVTTNLGNASARGRDFRSEVVASALNTLTTSVYKAADIEADDLIGGRATFFTPDDFIWKKKTKKKMKKKHREKKKSRKEMPKTSNSKITGVELRRSKRSTEPWIQGDTINSSDNFLKMHAFIVKDEDVPRMCGTAAEKNTETRYFMCSGVILNKNHVLTSASCMNRADIYEHHIDGELAVLIGALEKNSYVIKIASYAMHPRYEPDPNSKQHATNNVAVLVLECSIPRRSLAIPKLPRNKFNDVAHMCCPNRCKLSTVIEDSTNHQFIQMMEIKHLPSVTHNEKENEVDNSKKSSLENEYNNFEDNTDSENQQFSTNNLSIRKVRKPGRAPIPQFFTKDMAEKLKEKNSKNKMEKDNFFASLRDTDMENVEDAAKAEDGAKAEETADSNKDRKLNWKSVNKEISDGTVSEENKEKLSNFVKNSMSNMLTKMLETMTQHVANVDNVIPFFKNILSENTPKNDEKIQDSVGKEILKLALNKMDITSSENAQKKSKSDVADDNAGKENQVNKEEETKDNAADKSDKKNEQENKEKQSDEDSENIVLRKNVYCPPLGSPVITTKNVLVALIAYTCDDVQNWVEWKYVNIMNNVPWIRRKMTNSKPSIDNDNQNNL